MSDTVAAPADGASGALEKNAPQARLRLIDHFKRVYTIVVGLAITEAVRRLFPIVPTDLPVPALCMFATFFLTLVPIFHGGDRSLDVKYASTSQDTLDERASYLWDVYMLLTTAILFVFIAEAIPQKVASGSDAGSYPNAGLFYFFMAMMLVFDAFVLVVDRIKSKGKANLAAYAIWIFINIALGFICAIASYILGPTNTLSPASDLDIFGSTLSFQNLCYCVLALSLARTVTDYVADYRSGGTFLFP